MSGFQRVLGRRECLICHPGSVSEPHCAAEACVLKVMRSHCWPRWPQEALCKEIVVSMFVFTVYSKKGGFKSRLVNLKGHNTSTNAKALSLWHVLWQTASVLYCPHSWQDNGYLHPHKSWSMHAAHPYVSAMVQALVQFVWCKSSTVHI